MRNSKKNITKRNKKSTRKTTKKSTKCVYTDEAKRIMKMIKNIKKNKTSKKH
jgi:hypothetical protein